MAIKPFLALCVSIVVTLVCGTAKATIIPSGRSVAPSGFEENKGQVLTTAGDAAPFVRYRLTQGNTSIFLLGNGIAYQFNRLHYPKGYEALEKDARQDPAEQLQLDALRKEVRLETYRMDVLLEGANADARITTEGRSSDYTQYYGQNALDVHTYTRVTYHDVYPGIDWVVYTTTKGFEYDFVLRPGADPGQIQLRFKDYEELYLDPDGQLIHGNRMGRFTEERTVSIQNGRKVDSRFILNGDRLSFALGIYDHSQPLTIDPARIWGTYYGGPDWERGLSCAVDSIGNVYLAGEANSITAIASGGTQNNYGGGSTDAFLAKFDSNGTRQWGTYYGGVQSEWCGTCAVDGSDNVYLAGFTESDTAIASGGHQDNFGGIIDAFIVKFNASGVRLWASYYGGADQDWGKSCAVDGTGNVYLAGTTYSDTAIASDGFQNTLGDAPGKAFLVKFNSSGVRQWGTYYGEAGYAEGTSCTVDGSDNVYLAGSTNSDSTIASGGHQNINGGYTDAFLVKFNSSGNRLWGTYYGGSSDEEGKCCAVDGGGNVYLSGRTFSDTAIGSGGYQNMRAGSYDAFLVKFNSSGLRQWGTYYGGANYEYGYSCAADGSGNVYLTGGTGSDTTIASGGYQNTPGGSTDAFLVKFDASGMRQWGTYYGGINDDSGHSCAVDGIGNVYVAGITESDTAIAFGGHQNTFGGVYDAFLVKLDGGVANAIISLQGQQQFLPIWPNPNAGDRFFLQPQGTGLNEVQLFNALGQQLRRWQVQTNPAQAALEMDIGEELTKGLYLVRCTVNGRSSTAPLMIQ